MNIGKLKNLLLGSAILLFSLSSFTYLIRERKFITRNIKELISGNSDIDNYESGKKDKI